MPCRNTFDHSMDLPCCGNLLFLELRTTIKWLIFIEVLFSLPTPTPATSPNVTTTPQLWLTQEEAYALEIFNTMGVVHYSIFCYQNGQICGKSFSPTQGIGVYCFSSNLRSYINIDKITIMVFHTCGYCKGGSIGSGRSAGKKGSSSGFLYLPT